MALQFQPYPILQQTQGQNREQQQEQFNNLNQTLQNMGNSALNWRQQQFQNTLSQAANARATDANARAQAAAKREQQQYEDQQNAFASIPEVDNTLGDTNSSSPNQPAWGGNTGPTQSNSPMGTGTAPGTYPGTPQPELPSLVDRHLAHLASQSQQNPSPMFASAGSQSQPQRRFMNPSNPSEFSIYKDYTGMQNKSALDQSEITKNYATAKAEQGMTPQDMTDVQGGNWDAIGQRHGGVVPSKLVASGLSIGEKQDQFAQKEWDAIVKESNPLTASGRTGLGMASRADYNANRALVTLSKPIVTNQEAGNVMADIAQIYQGGSATQYGMSHQGYNTLYQKLQGAIQNITGNPQDALPDAIKNRLIGVLNEMKQTNKAVISQQLNTIEKAQPKIINQYKNEWQGIRQNLEQGIAGGPDQGTGGQGQPMQIGRFKVIAH